MRASAANSKLTLRCQAPSLDLHLSSRAQSLLLATLYYTGIMSSETNSGRALQKVFFLVLVLCFVSTSFVMLFLRHDQRRGPKFHIVGFCSTFLLALQKGSCLKFFPQPYLQLNRCVFLQSYPSLSLPLPLSLFPSCYKHFSRIPMQQTHKPISENLNQGGKLGL